MSSPVSVSSLTSMPWTCLLPMSALLTWPLTMSSLNTVFEPSSAIAVPLIANRKIAM